MTQQIAAKVLTLEEVRERLARTTDFDKNKHPKVLWPYRGNVEEGSVLFISDDKVDVLWLEGYKSRNDTVPLDQVLAVNDKKGPPMELFPFSGPGYLTEAGVKWQQDHPRD
jgi:hypothetical protein